MSGNRNHNNSQSAEELLVSFIEGILPQVRSWALVDRIPTRYRTRTRFRDSGITGVVEVERNYWRLIYNHREDTVWTTDDAKHVMRRLWDEDILDHLSRQGEDGTWVPETFDETLQFHIGALQRLVAEVLERHRTLHPSREQIVEAVRGLITKEAIFQVSIPIFNFTSELGDREIAKLCGLMPITAEEKGQIWDCLFASEFTDLSSLWKARFQLAGQYKRPRYPVCQNTELIDEAGRMIKSLRLVKAGDVGATVVVERDTSRFYDISSLFGISFGNGRLHPNIYHLLESDLPMFRDLLDWLEKVEQQPGCGGLAVALRRFNQSYERDSGEDRIIDLTIALESTLLSNIRDELKYRLAVRGAALLADMRDTRETFSLLKAIYDIRSAIVHDGTTLSALPKDAMDSLSAVGPPVQPDELPQRCEDLTREILREYVRRLALGETVRNVNTELDNMVLEGLKPLKGESQQGR